MNLGKSHYLGAAATDQLCKQPSFRRARASVRSRRFGFQLSALGFRSGARERPSRELIGPVVGWRLSSAQLLATARNAWAQFEWLELIEALSAPRLAPVECAASNMRADEPTNSSLSSAEWRRRDEMNSGAHRNAPSIHQSGAASASYRCISWAACAIRQRGALEQSQLLEWPIELAGVEICMASSVSQPASKQAGERPPRPTKESSLAPSH